jgi:3-hydroxymyristoyl/3-hydroxydecanoyl-(acyl carrier protein) dehydratase
MLDLDIDAIVRAGRKRVMYTPEPAHAVSLDRSAIERLLPHREPFLFVDHIDAATAEAITGRFAISVDDPLFRGHFPGDPLFPGVLQLEAIGQLGLCLYGLTGIRSGGVRAVRIHQAVFQHPVRPDAELRLIARSITADDTLGVCAGQLLVGDAICCVAVMEVYFVEA